MRSFSLVSAAIFTLIFFAASQAQEKKDRVIAGWGTVVDPDNDCKVSADKGKLTLIIPKVWHDLTYTDDYNKVNAPRVLKKVKGDFRLEVKVNEFALPENNAPAGGKFSFRSTGLLIWQNDKNFIRMERAGVPGASFIWVEGFQDGKSHFQNQVQVMGKTTKIQVERKGNNLVFS